MLFSDRRLRRHANPTFQDCVQNPLTRDRVSPYNILAFDFRGLIRRLGRMLSDLLSFEMGPTVGVMVSR